jgi:hypothetical protein
MMMEYISEEEEDNKEKKEENKRKHARERQRDISRGEAFVEKVFLDPSHSSSFLQES